MNELITILFTIMLQTNQCTIPQVTVACEEYRIQKTPVQVCEVYSGGNDYELVIEDNRIIEMWESYHSGMRPSFERGYANGVWKNIHKGAITGKPKVPEYCSVPVLDSNRHNK